MSANLPDAKAVLRSRIQQALPAFEQWLSRTLRERSRDRESVASFKFRRLAEHFRQETLLDAGIVVTTDIPRLPMAALGFAELKELEEQQPIGRTLHDTYFVRPGNESKESLHFHELIHIVQWRTLGVGNFCLLYAYEILNFGYAGSPLEHMAYEYQRQFDNGEAPPQIEGEIANRTKHLFRRTFGLINS